MRKITLFIALLLFTAFNNTAKAAETQTAACTAGNLATVAASYLTTVTNLTVTGTIDARDFKTMRDAMPLLEVIDLSGCTVAGYTGTEGTGDATSTSYPENGVPAYAFCHPSTDLAKTSLKTFVYPSMVTSIGNHTFYGCTGFTGVLTIPSTVTTIGISAFFYCNGFTGTLTIPSSITTIEGAAFSQCSGFTGTLTIPSSVKAIGYYAFSRCTGFTGTLSIPSSVTNIGTGAFYGCTGFTGTLTIPSSVTSIESYAFQGCSGFTGSLTIPSSLTAISNYTFRGCKGFTGILSISSSVTTIGDEAFDGCSGFTGTLTIPSSVKTIGSAAFYGCSGFTGSLTIPSSVKAIDNYAFYGCSGFTGSLTIPSSLTSIKYSTFEQCTKFTTLTIPSSVLMIGNNGFGYCSALTSIYAYATTPIDITSIIVFVGINKTTCILHVPVGKKTLYAEAEEWKDFINIVDDIVVTSIEEVQDFESISISPNPASSFITVSELASLVGNNIVTISIVDISGTTLLVKEVESRINSLSIDVSAFKNGIYFITLQTSNGSVVKRFVKE